MIRCGDVISGWASSPLARFDDVPWHLTVRAAEIVTAIAAGLDGYERHGDGVAVHPGARVEDGAMIVGPAIIGSGCFLARNCLVRGGCWLEADCVVGPGAELKSSFLFRGTSLAHFNFVGDAVIGAYVNFEAGAIVANRRNEWDGACVKVVWEGCGVDTYVEKFGALIGDTARIGANSVLAPGTILPAGAWVERLQLIDQTQSQID